MNRFSNLIFLTLTVFTVGVFTSCKKNEIAQIEQVTSHEDLPAEAATNVEILFSDSGQISLRIIASKLNRFEGEKPYMEFPEGVKLIFYNSNQEPESQIECNYAINHINDKIMEAKDDVVVINADGEKLNTEHLIWDQGNQLIHTEEFVKITTEDEIIYGNGMEAKEDFSSYKIKNLKGTISLEEEVDETEEENEDTK